jgi:hypothetical protein
MRSARRLNRATRSSWSSSTRPLRTPAGLPLRLEREGIEYALTEGHLGDPVRYDYSSAAAEEARPLRRRRRG